MAKGKLTGKFGDAKDEPEIEANADISEEQTITLPKKSEAKADVEAEDYGKGGVYKSIGGGKRVRV